MKAVCTADPLPEVSWYFNQKEITEDMAVKITEEHKEIQDNLKECTFTMHIPSGMNFISVSFNLGTYKIIINRTAC